MQTSNPFPTSPAGSTGTGSTGSTGANGPAKAGASPILNATGTATLKASDGMNSSADSVNRSVDSAGDKMHSTIDTLADPARSAVDRLVNVAHQSVDKLAGGATQTADLLSVQARRLNEAQARAVESSKTWIQDKPLEAVGVALALGFVLGRLTSN